MMKWGIWCWLIGWYCWMKFVVPTAYTSEPGSATSHHELLPFYREKCQHQQPKICSLIDMPIRNLSYTSLLNALETEVFYQQHHHPLLRHSSPSLQSYYVALNVTHFLDFNLLSFSKQYEELDQFLVIHPWWIVKQYPIPYNSHEHLFNPTHNNTTTITSSSHIYTKITSCILQRVPLYVEDSSRQFLAMNFKPEQECVQSPLYIKSSSGSWGIDTLTTYSHYFRDFADHIHGIYLTEHNEVHDRVGYVEFNQCFQLKNKHLCTFLPSTNCSLDSVIQKCEDGKDCIQEGVYTAGNRTYMRTLPDIDHSAIFAKVYHTMANFTPVNHVVYRIEDVKHLDQDHVVRSEESLFNNLQQSHIHNWIFNVAYKPNHHLGIRIQHFLRDFYHQHHSNETTTKSQRNHLSKFTMQDHCIAAHIRKGDRNLPGIDMLEFCKNHTKINEDGSKEPLEGLRPDGKEIDYSFWADMGCDFAFPYGTVTLQAVVNASLILHDDAIRQGKLQEKLVNLVISTDEHHTIKKELAFFEQFGYGRDRVRILVIPTKVNNLHVPGSRSTWQATTEWFASIEILRQCDLGFIAHPGSAASLGMFKALCYQHRDSFLQCPPFFQFNK